MENGYSEVDLHKHSWHITALADGEIVLDITLSGPTYEAFKKMLAYLKGNYLRIVWKQAQEDFTSMKKLSGHGIECMVIPPSLIPAQSGNRVKTDNKTIL